MSKTGDWMIEELNNTSQLTSAWLEIAGFYKSVTYEMGFSGVEYSRGLLFLTRKPYGWLYMIGLTDEWHLVGDCMDPSEQTIGHIKALCYGMGIKLNGDAK